MEIADNKGIEHEDSSEFIVHSEELKIDMFNLIAYD